MDRNLKLFAYVVRVTSAVVIKQAIFSVRKILPARNFGEFHWRKVIFRRCGCFH